MFASKQMTSLKNAEMDETDSQDVDRQNQFQCSICLNPYTKPKIIDCFHTFCEGCLKNYLSRYAGRLTFPCPLCRKNVRIPSKGVEGFMTNFYLEEKKVEKPEIVKKPQCDEHERDIDFYCEDCCLKICSKCISRKHARHTVKDFDDLVINSRKEMKEVHKNLDANLKTLQLYQKRFKEENKEIETIKLKQLKKIDDHCKKINKMVQDYGEQVKKTVLKRYEEENEKLEMTCRDTDKFIKETQRVADDVSKLLEKSDPLGVLEQLPYLKVKAIECENRVCFPLYDRQYTNFTPSPPHVFYSILENFGELETLSRPSESLFAGIKPSVNAGRLKQRKRRTEKRTTVGKPGNFSLEITTKKQILAYSVSADTESKFEAKCSTSSKPDMKRVNESMPVYYKETEIAPSTSSSKSEGESSCFVNGESKCSKVENSRDGVQKTEDVETTVQDVNSSSENTLQKEEILNVRSGSDNIPPKTVGITADKSDSTKDMNSNIVTFGDHFKFNFSLGQHIKFFDVQKFQYDFKFDINSVLDVGLKCRKDGKVLFKMEDFMWSVTVSHDNESRLSLTLDLETLGLYRVSFSIELVNLDNEKNSVCIEEQCFLIHGVWGPGYKWNNFVNLDLLADEENSFLDDDQKFLIRLRVNDDIYRLK